MKKTFIVGIRCSKLRNYDHLYWFYYVYSKQPIWVESILRCLGYVTFHTRANVTLETLQIIEAVGFRAFVRRAIRNE